MKTWAGLMSCAAVLSGVLCVSPASCASLDTPTRSEVMIVSMGSVYAIGYRIFVSPAGTVRYVPIVDTDDGYPDAEKAFTGQIPAAMARKLFQDVADAQPLSKLPVPGALDQPWTRAYMNKMAHQIGLRVQRGTDRSPNLVSPQSPQGQALCDDAATISRALHLTNRIRH